MSRITRALVVPVVRRWQARLGLEKWDIRVQVTTRFKARADCEASPKYLEAHIRFNPTLLPLDDLEATVVHELLHCHTWGLWSLAAAWASTPDAEALAEDAHELLTSTLQRVVMR